MFGSSTQEALGKCPKCGGDVVKGKFGAYCKKVRHERITGNGALLTDSQIKSMPEGEKDPCKRLEGEERHTV